MLNVCVRERKVERAAGDIHGRGAEQIAMALRNEDRQSSRTTRLNQQNVQQAEGKVGHELERSIFVRMEASF